MNALKILLIGLLAPALACAADAPAKHDGQHDFDWELGTWKTQLKRLKGPLTGSTTWLEYEGTTVVTKVWDGRANILELHVKGPAGAIEALSLRLYNPDTRQWSLNFSNSRSGTMAIPAIGEFKNGRGLFYNQDLVDQAKLKPPDEPLLSSRGKTVMLAPRTPGTAASAAWMRS